jgi:alpha-aminoadipate carrier protein LysW
MMSDFITCPKCAAPIPLANETVQGEIVECPNCGMETEVIWLEPLRLELAMEEEEWRESPAFR